MKLPIPETWETQVSLKGNKAKTWEDLLGTYHRHLCVFYFIAKDAAVGKILH